MRSSEAFARFVLCTIVSGLGVTQKFQNIAIERYGNWLRKRDEVLLLELEFARNVSHLPKQF